MAAVPGLPRVGVGERLAPGVGIGVAVELEEGVAVLPLFNIKNRKTFTLSSLMQVMKLFSIFKKMCCYYYYITYSVQRVYVQSYTLSIIK